MSSTQKNFQPVKGFRDFYPEDMALRKWLFSIMRQVSETSGYEEYDGPILEPVSLYEAKSNQELVTKQTFQLTDRGGRKLALRPELTPTLARMIAAKQYALSFPVRWFSIGPRFRYETPQKGRAREFYQWDVDLLGMKTPEADAEVIAIACRFFEKLGLTGKEVVIKVNNRKLMEFKLSLLDIPKNKMTYMFGLIDKKDKMLEKEWIILLEKNGLSADQIKNLRSILTDRDVAFESEEMTELFSTLKDLKEKRFVEYDPTIVRGLDYYTGTVFEARDRSGKLRAILGGGRYDNLVETFGGKSVSGIGFACGDMVVEEVLKYYNKYPKKSLINPVKTKVLVTVFNEETFRDSLKITSLLYSNEVACELYPSSSVSLDKQLKYANKRGLRFVAIIGPKEAKNSTITVKDLTSRTQETVSFEGLLAKLAQ